MQVGTRIDSSAVVLYPLASIDLWPSENCSELIVNGIRGQHQAETVEVQE